MLCSSLALILPKTLSGVEIPLESLTPVRIGYVDLQKVFDTYPEKSFAEGDLLREIEKRKRELWQKQSLISTLKQQISADETALSQAKSGAAVTVPTNNVPDQTPAPPPPAPPPPPAVSTSTVKTSTSAFTTPVAPVVEPYPLEDVTLPPEAETALEKRIDDNKRILERKTAEFKSFRGNAVADMKVLETQKTYGVMSKIYAVLQTLARDEGVTIVLDKSYVLYGEDTVDLSDKLIARLAQTEETQ
jgi:Skp family chaperone for outer membrane proteins